MNFPLQIHELGELFEAVQLGSIFSDGKTFPDCIPKRKLEDINADFKKLKERPGFSLKDFVHENFELPTAPQASYKTDASQSATEHIHHLWDLLTRQPYKESSSIIPLPKPYVVPGGRFREIYYWDSYFTMLGLLKSERVDLASNMVENFSYLINNVGYVPNGNRTYFIGRSQPPFFSLMLKLLAADREELLEKYLDALEKEYSFWMTGSDTLKSGEAAHRVVKLSDGSVLNRYWDEKDTPRPESFKEDAELSHHTSQKPGNLFRNLRAAAESGWDFSSRWFKEGEDFSSTHTTEIIPVDLNCLMFHLEQTLSDAHRFGGNKSKADEFLALAQKRKSAIRKYCWDAHRYVGNKPKADAFLMLAQKRKSAIRKYCWDVVQNFYFDYDFKSQKLNTRFTLAGFFAMFLEIATPDQAEAMAVHLESKFLKPGGLTTTLEATGQQWDAPNGWAPLQWVCFKGLLNYGHDDLASEVKKRWLATNEAVFKKTGKMTEKYNVWNENADASGGEYPNQDGFGWTNGVYLAMILSSHR